MSAALMQSKPVEPQPQVGSGPDGQSYKVGSPVAADVTAAAAATPALHITGSAARTILRASRTNTDLHLEPTNTRIVSSPQLRRPTLDELGLATLLTILGPQGNRPLDIRVPSHETRVRVRGLQCHICSAELPPGSFDRLCLGSTDGAPASPGVSASTTFADGAFTVLVDSARLWFADSARTMQRMVRQGRLSYAEAVHRLIKLAVEDCASYALDPWYPMERDAHYDLSPAMTPAELREYVAQLRRMPGVKLAREASELVFAGAASPMEAFLVAALSLPVHLGGMGLEAPELNGGVDLDDAPAGLLNHTESLTPDLIWRELRIVIEYFGDEPHSGKSAREEDAGRLQDYAALRYIAFPLMYKHVRSPEAFNRFVRRLARAMEERGRRGTVKWVEELLADQDFLARQRMLFSVWLPVVSARE